jgi:signal peptidase
VELMMATNSDAVLAPTRMGPSRTAWSTARRAGNVVGTAISVLVVMIGCVGIVIAAATHFAPEGEYTVFGHPTMIVLSGSMAPAINTGDLVIDNSLGAADAGGLQAGQIISFRPSATAKVITHRIAQVTSVGGAVAYVTKGDANNAADTTPVAPSQIVGVYNTKVSSGGYILNALHQPLTLAFLLAAPALWFLSGLFFQWAKQVDADDKGGAR